MCGIVGLVSFNRERTIDTARLTQMRDRLAGRPLAEEAERLRGHLTAAVRRHLMSDVPLDVCLSGGLDSSALAALAAGMVQEPLRTFAVGFDDAATSELPYARLVADAVGAVHRDVVVTPREYFASLPRLIWQEDEPIAFTSSVPLYFVSAPAREEVKVALKGEGADDRPGWISRCAGAARAARPRPSDRQPLGDAPDAVQRVPVAADGRGVDHQPLGARGRPRRRRPVGVSTRRVLLYPSGAGGQRERRPGAVHVRAAAPRPACDARARASAATPSVARAQSSGRRPLSSAGPEPWAVNGRPGTRKKHVKPLLGSWCRRLGAWMARGPRVAMPATSRKEKFS